MAHTATLLSPPELNNISPVVICGQRRIKAERLSAFKKSYQSFSESTYTKNPDLKAIFAFPDKEDPLVYWHILWVRNASACKHTIMDYRLDDNLQSTYASSSEEPDKLTIFGGRSDDLQSELERDSSVEYEYKDSLAGFIKANGSEETGPPLFGFTKRYVKPDKLQALGRTFEVVSTLWFRKINGILLAAVFPDKNTPNLVHDLRIFANHKSYLEHVDKSDPVLTAAMGKWFENYDTSIPFAGQLYAMRTNDEALHTSSIKSSTTPRAQLETFHFGTKEMLGLLPDMTRNDI